MGKMYARRRPKFCLEIKVLVNCIGVEEYNILWYHKSEWDKIQEQGYYMA